MPEPKQPRILIIGAGAVGAYVGGYFAHGGHEVILADPWPEHVEATRAQGLRLAGLTAEECFTTQVRILHLTELQSLSKERPADIAIVAVKSYDTAWATALAQQYLAADGFVLSLQNSINEPTIATIVGWGHTIGCVASKIVVELVEPGFVRRGVAKGGDRHTVFRIGEPHGRSTARVQILCAMLAKIDSAKVTQNLWGERWTKLVQNAMSNAVSAATGLSMKQANLNESCRRLAIRLAAEGIRVGQAQGYALENVNSITPELWVQAETELLTSANATPALTEIEQHMENAATKTSDTARPSMGQDIIKGRRTEIEQINGMVVKEAATVGLTAPANAALIKVVQAVENGAIPAHIDRIANI